MLLPPTGEIDCYDYLRKEKKKLMEQHRKAVGYFEGDQIRHTMKGKSSKS